MIDISGLSGVGSGSYQPDDVTFLLREMNIDPTETAEKERLIQSGEKHYSEMVSMERAPSPAHLAAVGSSAPSTLPSLPSHATARCCSDVCLRLSIRARPTQWAPDRRRSPTLYNKRARRRGTGP